MPTSFPNRRHELCFSKEGDLTEMLLFNPRLVCITRVLRGNRSGSIRANVTYGATAMNLKILTYFASSVALSLGACSGNNSTGTSGTSSGSSETPNESGSSQKRELANANDKFMNASKAVDDAVKAVNDAIGAGGGYVLERAS